ncbi:MAG: phosphatidylserine decarboxylase [Endomicrobiales bacterium]
MFMVKEGLPFVLVPGIIGVLFLSFSRNSVFMVLGGVLIALALFCAFFFRDPSRAVPQGEGLVLSPCDGTVMEVLEEGNAKVVRVFLSVLNVHLQRSPVSGVVKSVEYRPGKFLPAMKSEAHIVNEQNVITIASPDGEFVVKQIAGILARRVVSRVKPGEALERGQKIGLIKFGSQVDLELPLSSEIRVKAGDTVVAGETVYGVIARQGVQ